MNRHIHHVRSSGRETSISLEPAFWDHFRLMAIEQETSIKALIDEIEHTERLLPYQGPKTPRVLALSAAVRVFVLRDLMRKLADAEARASRRLPSKPRKRRAEGRPWRDHPVPRAGA